SGPLAPGDPDDDQTNEGEYRFERLEADPGQLGELETDQPRASQERQFAGIPVIAPLPPSGHQKAAADQSRQEHTRHAPVTERGPAQPPRLRPQQRATGGGRQQPPAHHPRGPSYNPQGGQGAPDGAGPPLARGP